MTFHRYLEPCIPLNKIISSIVLLRCRSSRTRLQKDSQLKSQVCMVTNAKWDHFCRQLLKMHKNKLKAKVINRLHLSTNRHKDLIRMLPMSPGSTKRKRIQAKKVPFWLIASLQSRKHQLLSRSRLLVKIWETSSKKLIPRPRRIGMNTWNLLLTQVISKLNCQLRRTWKTCTSKGKYLPSFGVEMT
jgi:hypothetical protein